MANYSFRCQDCGAEFEISCKYEERLAALCPDCGSGEKTQLFKPFSFVMKQDSAACEPGFSCGGCCQGSCQH